MRKIKIGMFVFLGLLFGYTTSSLAYDSCFQSEGDGTGITYNYYFFSHELGEGNFVLAGHAYKDAVAGEEPTHGNFISVGADETRMTLVRSANHGGAMVTATVYVTMNTATSKYEYVEKLDKAASQVVYTSGTFISVTCPEL